MVKFLSLEEDLRRQIISQAGILRGMNANAVEKDWWVTLVLKALFALPMRTHFIFKGGTSLSKGWKLIERFSEDIDIALSPEAFGMEYKVKPTHSYVKTLKRKGTQYTNDIIMAALMEELAQMGVPAALIKIEADEISPTFRDKDPHAIFVYYHSLFEVNDYLPARVKIEFGVRALREPFSDAAIQSIIAEAFPTPVYSEEPFPVPTVEPRKTFMEKLMLLHERFSTGDNASEVTERQSRHLSDLGAMAKKGILQQVIDDVTLYKTLLEHRRHYIRLKGVDYDRMQLRDLWVIPPPVALVGYRKDYDAMLVAMIYGTPPDFDTLIDILRELNGVLAMCEQGK